MRDLVRVHIELACQLRKCPVAAHCGKSHFRLELCRVVTAGSSAHLSLLSPRALSCPQSGSDSTYPPVQISGATSHPICNAHSHLRCTLGQIVGPHRRDRSLKGLRLGAARATASVRPLREGEKRMERRRRRAIVALRLPLVLTPLRPFHTPARPVHGPQVRQRREPPGLDRPQDQHQDPDEILRADGPLPMRPVTDVIVGRSMVRHPQQSDQMAPAIQGRDGERLGSHARTPAACGASNRVLLVGHSGVLHMAPREHSLFISYTNAHWPGRRSRESILNEPGPGHERLHSGAHSLCCCQQAVCRRGLRGGRAKGGAILTAQGSRRQCCAICLRGRLLRMCYLSNWRHFGG